MNKTDLLQGTLDLLVLRTLMAGSLHGYAIAQRIQQRSDEVLVVEEGSLYPALHRMEESGLIKANWATTDKNRRARVYQITRTGMKELEQEESRWRNISNAIGRVLKEA